jgi:hypothetical protein
LILLAFFFPLALYLLVLGAINRRDRPLVVWGVWDFLGILFAASGFLLFVGPAVLSSLNERWRMYWLFGQHDQRSAGSEGGWEFWIFLSLLYFVTVAAGSVFLLWRQRRLTSIYNVDGSQVERALEQVCEALRVEPVRSGDLFLFGLAPHGPKEQTGRFAEKIQAPHYLPGPRASVPELTGGRSDPIISAESAVLEVERFPLLHHVTLRWDPADSPLRGAIEAGLEERLKEMPGPPSNLGGWLLVVGTLLMAFELFGVFAIIAVNLFRH